MVKGLPSEDEGGVRGFDEQNLPVDRGSLGFRFGMSSFIQR